MMDGHGKSDTAIVAGKLANKAEQSAAEPVERRAETEGNADQQARAGRSAGKPCHKRWRAYDKLQGKGRRNGSRRSSTTSTSNCCGTHSLRSSGKRPPAWTG